MTQAQRKLVAPRFWAKVLKSDGCWEWQAAFFKGRGRCYGMFKLRGRCMKAHRVAFELERGEIDDGLVLLHDCDNPKCVRPDHLKPGSHVENMADMRRKGRSCCHERKNTARLTAGDVHEIRIAAHRGGATAAALARVFGVGHSAVRDLLRGKTWVSIVS